MVSFFDAMTGADITNLEIKRIFWECVGALEVQSAP